MFNIVRNTNVNLNEEFKKLNKEQLMAVNHKDNPLLVIAGAGSGKTSVLTLRIAKLIHEGVPANRQLIVTFTNQAKDNMIDRLNKYIGEHNTTNLNIGTFHSICFKMLKEQSYIPTDFQIIPKYKQEEIINNYKTILGKRKINTGSILSWISYQKNELRTWNEDFSLYKNVISDTNISLKDYIDFYRFYEQEKKKNKYIDYGDMILLCYEMLNRKTNIREYYQNLYKYISVDEAQDSSESLSEIIKILAGKYNNVFMVGDLRQSIYSFANAKVEKLLEFKKEWKDSNVMYLITNYRSNEEIVSLCNTLANFNKHEYMKGNAIAFRGKGEKPIFKCCSTEYSEAEYILRKIEELKEKGYEYSDMAIIYRTNDQACPIESVLSKYKVPYLTLGGNNFFSKKEILDIISYVQLAKNPNDDVAFTRIYNSPTRYLSKEFITKLKLYAKENNMSLYNSLQYAPFLSTKKNWNITAKNLYSLLGKLHNIFLLYKEEAYRVVEEVITHTFYKEYLNSKSSEEDITIKIENLEALLKLSQAFKTADTFVKYCNKIIYQNEENEKQNIINKVRLLTGHKAKGMEFKITFCIGNSQGLLPYKRSLNIEEERRNCYVNISRAEDLLFITYPLSYKNKSLTYSQFLKEMLGEEEIKKLEENIFSIEETFDEESKEQCNKDGNSFETLVNKFAFY